MTTPEPPQPYRAPRRPQLAPGLRQVPRPIPPVTRSLPTRAPAPSLAPEAGQVAQAERPEGRHALPQHIGLRQRLVEVLLGIPRGCLTSAASAAEIQHLQEIHHHDVSIRDQQIAAHRWYLRTRGLAGDYWTALIEHSSRTGQDTAPQ